jgi:hypothetical protein
MRGRPPKDRYGRTLPPGSVDELAHAEDPAEVTASAREAWLRGMALFDAERFFEAHEFFEHVWKAPDVDEGDRPFWQGVTQVAVGCCHVQRGNARSAVAVLERAAGLFDGYPSPHHGIDTTALMALAHRLAADVRQHGTGDVRFGAMPLGS